MTKKKKATQSPSDGLSGRKLVYDYFLHEAERISQRIDWFLIFNAILLEAFFAVTDENHQWPPIVLAVFGTLVNYLWAATGIRAWYVFDQLGQFMESAESMGDEMAKQHRSIFERRRNSPIRFRWASPAPTFSVVIPTLTFFLWVCLSLSYGTWLSNLVLVLLVLFISGITKEIGPGPHFRRQSQEPLQPTPENKQ